MKKIRLTIDTRESAYGRQLAKGLAITGKHLFITMADHVAFADSSDHSHHAQLCRVAEHWEGDVYLTDRIYMAERIGRKAILLMQGKEMEYTGVFTDEAAAWPKAAETYRRLDSMAALREIYRMIVDVYQTEQGCFIPGAQGKSILYGFLPATGGCGATALAITFGRILAGRDSERVLYIQQGSRTGRDKGYSLYFEGEKMPLRPSRELEFLLLEGKCFCIENYMAEDRYGLFYLRIQSGIEQLLRHLEKENAFSSIILDGKGCDKNAALHKVFYVLNRQDCRTEFLLQNAKKETEEDPDRIILLNQCGCFKETENLFWLPRDEESFRCEENHVEISMHMAFARAMRTVAKEAVQ